MAEKEAVELSRTQPQHWLEGGRATDEEFRKPQEAQGSFWLTA